MCVYGRSLKSKVNPRPLLKYLPYIRFIETLFLGDVLMEILYSTELSVPLFQITLLLTLTTLALLFGKMRLALLINYLFTFYWGFIFNQDFMLKPASTEVNNFAFAYFGFGFMIVILALFGFLAQRN